jgi:Zn-dependent peptidase ImmA (M78 family)
VFRQRFTACHEAGHAILDDGEDFVVSFTTWNKGDLSEIRANTFASWFLMPPSVVQSLSITWTKSTFLDCAARLMVNAEPLAYALRDLNLIDDGEADTFKRLKVPAETKKDPELPDFLAPRSRQRKQELLQRGLSDAYVSLCFDSYDRGIISASRLAEMLLIVETELGDLAALYGRSLSHGD